MWALDVRESMCDLCVCVFVCVCWSISEPLDIVVESRPSESAVFYRNGVRRNPVNPSPAIAPAGPYKLDLFSASYHDFPII